MIEVGKKQILKVDSEDSSGFYLLCQDNKEVFMPGTLAEDGLKPGNKAEVFVFINSNGDEIATSAMPKAEVGDFACLTVTDITPHGAYLDIGLPKDLLIPKKLQKYEMNIGEIHLVKVLLEEETNRMYGTEKLGPHIESAEGALKKRKNINIVPFHKTPLGYKVLINNKYLGLIYHNEIFQDVKLGKEYEGTVKAIRPDGQVDALLQKVGVDAVLSNSHIILEALKESGGKLYLCDKSSPEDIKYKLSMSKKAFKTTIGALYKQRTIIINNDSIELVSK